MEPLVERLSEPLAKYLPLLGRLLLSVIFIQGGISKIEDIGRTVATMSSHGVPFADLLVYPTIALELGGGLLLLAGLWTRWVALALCLYTLVLALTFHAFWTFLPPDFRTQRGAFFEHLGLMGGLLYIVAFGPGPFSLEWLFRPARRLARA